MDEYSIPPTHVVVVLIFLAHHVENLRSPSLVVLFGEDSQGVLQEVALKITTNGQDLTKVKVIWITMHLVNLKVEM